MVYMLRKNTVVIRQDVLIFWKSGNFIAKMQGCHALKQFVRKGGMSFSRMSHTRCLSGSIMCCEIKKNYSINFQRRRKNVIMVVYGKSYCGPCPVKPRSSYAINIHQHSLQRCQW